MELLRKEAPNVSRTIEPNNTSSPNQFEDNRPSDLSFFPKNDGDSHQLAHSFSIQSISSGVEVRNSLPTLQCEKKINQTGLPDVLKSGIESLSGFSMDNVRVHYNSSKPATVQALAYTQGTDIHVAPGQEKHLPHEAWHVVQQMSGRVSPTTTINGMPVNDNVTLEHEADVMGAKALQRERIVNTSIMQRKVVSDQSCQLKQVIQCDRADDVTTNTGFSTVEMAFSGSGYTSWGNQGIGIPVATVGTGNHQVLMNNNIVNAKYVVRFSFPGPQFVGGAINWDPSIGQIVTAAVNVMDNILENNLEPFNLLIKGHSRGAVAAGEFYNRMNNNNRILHIELLMLDPVPGGLDGGWIYPEVTLGDENFGDRKVVFYSLGINQEKGKIIGFTPEKVRGADVIVLTHDRHSCGIATNPHMMFTYQNVQYSCERLADLANGVYVCLPNNELYLLSRGNNIDAGLLERNPIVRLLFGEGISGSRAHNINEAVNSIR